MKENGNKSSRKRTREIIINYFFMRDKTYKGDLKV